MIVSGLMFVYVNELRLSGPFLVDGCTAHVIDPGGGLKRLPPVPFGPDDVLGVGAAGGDGGWGSANAGAAVVAIMPTASRPDATAKARRRHRISRRVLIEPSISLGMSIVDMAADTDNGSRRSWRWDAQAG